MGGDMMPGEHDNEPWVFTVWAPEARTMLLHLVRPDALIAMRKDPAGFFRAGVSGVKAGDRYYYRPDGAIDYPDPASHYQPEGVHGPSELVDHKRYPWQDLHWKGLPFSDLIFYEVH